MSSRNESVDDQPIVRSDRVRKTMQAILRAAQTEGWTDQSLEDASGVKKETIKGYRVDGKEPSLSRALSLAVVLGPRALNPMLALIGYTARALDEGEDLKPMQIVADGLSHFNVIAQAAADGRFDHAERPKCREAADMLIATVLPLSSAGDAA